MNSRSIHIDFKLRGRHKVLELKGLRPNHSVLPGYGVCNPAGRLRNLVANTLMRDDDSRAHRRPLSGWGIFAIVGVLLCFGALNIAVRATYHKLEDGVLWDARPEGVTAADVAARSTAMAAGIRRGDVLIAVNG